MNTIRPGDNGDPLPKNTLVFRIGKNTQLSQAALGKKKALPEMFELSTEDKNTPGQRLTVWVEELTIADQAWAFMGSKPERTVVACLHVDRIRALVSPNGFTTLDVHWEADQNKDGTRNTALGADGHAGIANLNQGGKNKQDNLKRKKLRMMLADLAEISPCPVPHDFAEDRIRIAAYYISQKLEFKHVGEELHWVLGVRQLRRARVNEAKHDA